MWWLKCVSVRVDDEREEEDARRPLGCLYTRQFVCLPP